MERMRFYFALLVSTALTVSCAPRARTAQVKLPPPQPAMERQIRNAMDVGDGDYEVRALRQRMAIEPNSLDVRLALAKRYEALGSPELALEHYRLAAGRFPESAEVALRLAKALRQAGLRGEAATALDRFLSVHPQSAPEYASWQGILHDELGQWTEGEKSHRAALDLAPKSDYLHNNLGYNLLMQGKADAAAAEFRAALQLNPRSALARNNLGLALAHKPDQAVVNWQSASDPASAHNNMAALLIEQGRYAEARKELDLALGYNRNHPAALNNLRLVSELDGQPAFIRVKPVEGRWARVKTGLRKAFVADKNEPESAASNTTPENRRGL